MRLASSYSSVGGTSTSHSDRQFDAPAAVEQAVRLEVARELHDEVVQGLAFLLLQMEEFKERQVGRLGVQAEVAGYQSSLRETLRNIREVLHGLRNTRSDTTADLAALIGDTVALVQARTGMRVTLSRSDAWPPLPARIAVEVQRIVQEALTNAALHSEGDRVHVRMFGDRDGNAVITVADNGKSAVSYISQPAHFGLAAMRERADAIGGSLTIERSAKGGTVVRLAVPRARLR